MPSNTKNNNRHSFGYKGKQRPQGFYTSQSKPVLKMITAGCCQTVFSPRFIYLKNIPAIVLN